MKNKKLISIVKEVERHFSFLYENGYKIRNSEYSPEFNGNWNIEFESKNSIIYFICDRNEIALYFSPLKNTKMKDLIGIDQMIYILSNGNNAVKPFKGNLAWGRKKQFERLAKLVKEHIDQIIIYFENIEN